MTDHAVASYSFISPVLQELQARGFLYQCSDFMALDKRLAEGPITFYIGFDATATSLHVGNLMTLMVTRIMLRHGHHALVLIGEATTKIGDPTGKDKQRKVLEAHEVRRNVTALEAQIKAFLKADGAAPSAAVASLQFVNNETWLSPLKYLDFLRDYGSCFTINRMLTFDSVKNRLERESPLTYLEFNYLILQAFDFLELYRKHDCILQLGGADQWSNILSGMELIRRKEQAQAFALTIPLITNTSGQKMGKTTDGAVWLDKIQLTPFDYWQFWRNTHDDDVLRFMRFFTDLPLPTLRQYEGDKTADINGLKKQLANEATTLVHGPHVLSPIHSAVEHLFEKGSADLTSKGKDAQGNSILECAVPIHKQPLGTLKKGMDLIDLLVSSQLTKSKGEARRLIQGGGCRVNDEKVSSDATLITETHLDEHRTVKIAAGKKKFVYIQFLQGDNF